MKNIYAKNEIELILGQDNVEDNQMLNMLRMYPFDIPNDVNKVYYKMPIDLIWDLYRC